MARHYKKWEDHTPRWQREQSRKGLSQKRWNAWLKLSEKTRKTTDPRQYASGKGIADQRRERKIQQAVARIRSATPQSARTSVIQNNVRKMSDKDLEWTLKASPKSIRQRASNKHVQGYPTNPWWYR